jgi:dihydroxyacetone kinase-like predicted kinase
VQYLLEARDEALPTLRQALDRLGDSLVVVGGGGMFNVHVHTDDPESAVDAARAVGRPRDVSITSLPGRVVTCLGAQAREVRIAEQTCALVAVAAGEGLARTFASLGALVVRGGPGSHSLIQDLLAAIEAAPANAVLVLGNDRAVMPIAERAAAESTKDAWVAPSSAAPSGLAAAAAFNPLLSLEINVKAMAEAALGCRAGELLRAERDPGTPAGSVRRGDWLGVIEGEVVLGGASIDRAAVGVARRLGAQDPEILTVITGAEADASDSDAIGRALRQAFPLAVVEFVEGGQPDHPFLIGVE